MKILLETHLFQKYWKRGTKNKREPKIRFPFYFYDIFLAS